MNISKIVGSLAYGRLFSGKWMSFFYIILVSMLIFPAITIITLIITFTVGFEWPGEMVGFFIGCNIYAGLLIAVYVSIIVRNKKLRKKIIIWLEDAIQVKAHAKIIDSVRLGIQPKQAKIKIDFKIDGKKYSRISSGKMPGGGPEGYHKIWANYADREINILYSSKYDQVLILKDNQ